SRTLISVPTGILGVRFAVVLDFLLVVCASEWLSAPEMAIIDNIRLKRIIDLGRFCISLLLPMKYQ
ncbi:MAG: hypothetical protein L0220_27305, partial [Acidobacteria bacterium]|nr:hypothetical protein [Acidobacteriota bacterium]